MEGDDHIRVIREPRRLEGVRARVRAIVERRLNTKRTNHVDRPQVSTYREYALREILSCDEMQRSQLGQGIADEIVDRASSGLTPVKMSDGNPKEYRRLSNRQKFESVPQDNENVGVIPAKLISNTSREKAARSDKCRGVTRIELCVNLHQLRETLPNSLNRQAVPLR
jgi:hypothetical protein